MVTSDKVNGTVPITIVLLFRATRTKKRSQSFRRRNFWPTGSHVCADCFVRNGPPLKIDLQKCFFRKARKKKKKENQRYPLALFTAVQHPSVVFSNGPLLFPRSRISYFLLYSDFILFFVWGEKHGIMNILRLL